MNKHIFYGLLFLTVSYIGAADCGKEISIKSDETRNTMATATLGNYSAVGLTNGYIRVYNIDSGTYFDFTEEGSSWSGHDGPITQIRFINETTIRSRSEGISHTRYREWDIVTRKCIGAISMANQPFYNIPTYPRSRTMR